MNAAASATAIVLAGTLVAWFAYLVGERRGERRGVAMGRRLKWTSLDERWATELDAERIEP